MQRFHRIFLEDVQIDKAEGTEKKAARNRKDAGGSLTFSLDSRIGHHLLVTFFNTTAERAGTYSLSHSLRSFL